MALWLDPGSEPQTEQEKADLEAITALKQSSALELKEKGNEFVKKGKKHYSDAIDCYTRAIDQKVLNEQETSVLFSNRAHVNLLLGNNRRALEDSEQAIKLSPTNVKAFYRAAKASLALDLYKVAKSYCERGLELSSDNEDLKKMRELANAKVVELEKRETAASNAVKTAEALFSAFEDRVLKIGKAMYRELTGMKKPVLDKSKILHWPVLLLYPEVMSSDLIEDFCETDMFSSHLDSMFSDSCPPLPWDSENAYTRNNIEIYFEVGSSPCLSKKQILRYLLEGTAGAGVESIGEADGSPKHGNPAGRDPSRWVKVNEKRTLHDVLKEPNFVIPGIPVFYVVSRSSSFYNKFISGKWAPPEVLHEDSD